MVKRRRGTRFGWGAIVVGALLLLGAAPAGAVDGDHDGVPNSRDRCPGQAGPRPSGCPVGQWRLRNTNSPGPANVRFTFGISAWTPVAGDWDGDGADTVGAYDPQNGKWRLAELAEESDGEASVIRGVSECVISSIVASGPRIPITGDWDGDGDDTVGLYTPASGQFHLRNSNTTGPPDIVFAFGGVQPRRQIRAVAGDFDGDGDHTVGLFRRDTGTWSLRNTNSAGPADLQFVFAPGNPSGASGPVVGDWDGNGTETVGLFEARQELNDLLLYSLSNTNAPGPADLNWSWGGTNSGSFDVGGNSGVVGDWDGNGTHTTGFRAS